jgi:D-sedoheptulose 7-phosphate isomerase
MLKTDLHWQRQRITLHMEESSNVKRSVSQQCMEKIIQAAQKIGSAFQNGNKLLLCGNGGSAADCQHLAAEFVNTLTKNFIRKPLPAIALTTDTSFITAYGNDSGFDGIFERQVYALGQRGDVLLGITTSGNSVNVVRAFQAAKALQIHTIALMGETGRIIEMAEIAIKIPSQSTQYIQESHLAIEHLLCELVEQNLFGVKGS